MAPFQSSNIKRVFDFSVVLSQFKWMDLHIKS
jgi:hypothetical protein